MIPSDRAFAASPTVRALLERHPARGPPSSAADAAVLIVLRPSAGGSGVETLLIQRAERDGDTASGQVSLPGGRVDAADRALADTAIRETEEEVGLGLEDLATSPKFVGQRHAAAFGLDVGIFATELSERARPAIARSPREVAEVFWMPLQALERVDSVSRPTSQGPRPVDATVHRGFVVWGFTRRVLREFYGLPEPAGPAPHPPVRRGGALVPTGGAPARLEGV